MQDKSKRVLLPSKQRQAIYRLWRKGHSFAEIAKRMGMYRQKPRSIVLSFHPSFEDYRAHDHFRRLRQFSHELNPKQEHAERKPA